MGDLSYSAVQTQNRKARQFPRSPVLFASIQLGKNLQGFILNASEGGVCVQTAREIVGDEPLDLRFQSVRPGGWVQARGRVVWKNETNTVAGLQFIDNNTEIAGEVRNWLSFGESLQELRGNWWPDATAAGHAVDQPAMRPAAFDRFPTELRASDTAKSDAAKNDAAIAPSPAPIPAPVEEFAPLPPIPLSQTLPPPPPPPEQESRTKEAQQPEQGHNGRPPLRMDVLIEFVPEPSKVPEPPLRMETHEHDEHPGPVPVPKTERYTYDYVRPDSGEEHKGKFAVMAAGGACLFVLLIWFALAHRSQPTSQAKQVASNESSSATAPQAVVPPAPAEKPANPPAASQHSASTKSAAPASQKPVAPPSASAKAGVLPTSGSKPQPTASTTQSAPAGNSGMVIQVGAMAEEANATKLATALTMQHFPAFVSKHTTDRFYRVLVGPFPSATSLRETEQNLQKAGYQTLEKRWTP